MGQNPNHHGPEGTDHQHQHGEHKPPHTGVEFFIELDDKNLSFDHRYVTGREIMTAGHVHHPETYDLWQKIAGGKRLIGLDDKVDLEEDGIERFITVPKKRTDGRGAGHAPPLSDNDLAFLERIPNDCRTESWQGNLLVKIKKWPLPAGYNQQFVDLVLVVPLTYPSAQIDMFYLSPAISRLDGKAIPNLTNENFNGSIWQRWSRHRENAGDWRAGIDCIETHLCFVDSCLIAELVR